MSLCVRKPTIWVPTRSDTNQAVQSQKMARGLKFCIKVEEELYYTCCKNKGAFVLAQAFCRISYALAQLLCHLFQQNKILDFCHLVILC